VHNSSKSVHNIVSNLANSKLKVLSLYVKLPRSRSTHWTVPVGLLKDEIC